MRCTRLKRAIEIVENLKKLFVKVLIQSSLCRWELKAMTGSRHCCLSFAFFLSQLSSADSVPPHLFFYTPSPGFSRSSSCHFPRWSLMHGDGSPYFLSLTIRPVFQSSDMFSDIKTSQKKFERMVNVRDFSACSRSALMPSAPGALKFFIFLMALLIS